jgi:N-acetylglucosamine kinase-like BadF-type ATPase
MLVIGVDVGGTGARAALAGDEGIIAHSRLDGISNKADAVRDLVADLLQGGKPSDVDCVAMGSTGFALTGKELRERVPAENPARKVLLCSDMLTSFLGAMGLREGAVVAAGTGAVALGSDMRGEWRRVDGWGYHLGDHGGGSWIGRQAMYAALRASDGRPGGSATLLKLLDRDFEAGPAELVAEITDRPDRAGIMAGFVPAVAQASREGDPVATRILVEAADHLADTALAALPPGALPRIVTTGNLFKLGGPLWDRFTARLRHVRLEEAKGTGLDGAIILAKAAIRDELPANAPSLTVVRPG